MMGQETWSAVDQYFGDLLVPADPALAAALANSDAAGLPPHSVSPSLGKLLQLLAQMRGARAILEIGTLGGYSTIWLARALPRGGRLVTLEADPKHAEVASVNICSAGLSSVVDLRTGSAVDILPRIHDEGAGPFDLIFIDADKSRNPLYLNWALKLSRPGSVIIGDNIVRNGAVKDPSSEDPSVKGVRRFLELIAAEPRLSATAIQTVGRKGYDGVVIAIVSE